MPGASGWESIEHLGVLTRTVADTALMLSVLAGPDPRDRHSIPCHDIDWTAAALRGREEGCAGLRIAYSPDLGYLPVDPAVRAVAEDAVSAFRGLGCTVEEVDPGWSDPAEAFQAIITAETDLTGMRRLVDQYGPAMSPHLAAWMTRDWTARELTDANIARKALTNRMAALMSEYDLLITPTAAVPPSPSAYTARSASPAAPSATPPGSASTTRPPSPARPRSASRRAAPPTVCPWDSS